MYKIYKKYFWQLLIIVGLLVSLVATFNFYVDPANHFYNSHTLENEIATNLLAKKSIKLSYNYNERSVQKLMLSKMINRPDILVLGSSHSLVINQHNFPKSSFYNASVPSATFEDDLALYYLFTKRGWQPKILIICLDPWILDSNFSQIWMPKRWQEQWKSTFPLEYREALRMLGNQSQDQSYLTILSGKISKYLQLLSLDYSIASIKQFKIKGNSKNNFEKCDYCEIRNPDGSRTPSLTENAVNGEQADMNAMDQIQYLRESFRVHEVLNKNNTNTLFENFVQYVQRQQVKIIFYFPALESKGFESIDNSGESSVKVVERYFQQIANKYNIQTIGSYDPIVSGLKAVDFIDGWHLKREAMNAIFLHSNNVPGSNAIDGT